MANLPNEILSNIFSFLQFDLSCLPSSESSDPYHQLFELIMKITSVKALAIYKGERNILDDDEEEFDSDHQILHKLFNFFSPNSYDKESFLLQYRNSNIKLENSIAFEMQECRADNIDVLFESPMENMFMNAAFKNYSNGLEDYARAKRRIPRLDVSFPILNQAFSIGFLGQFIMKLIHFYPFMYCNISLVSTQWRKVGKNQQLWKVSTGLLQEFLRFRAKLEFSNGKSNRPTLSLDENTSFYVHHGNDSALIGFKDEFHVKGTRFPILYRHISSYEKNTRAIPPLIDQAKSDILLQNHSENIFDSSYKSFLAMKSMQSNENRKREKWNKAYWCFQNVLDRIFCHPFVKKSFLIIMAMIFLLTVHDMIGIVGEGLNNQLFLNETLQNNQTIYMHNPHFNTDSFIRDLSILNSVIFTSLMCIYVMARRYSIPACLHDYSITISTTTIASYTALTLKNIFLVTIVLEIVTCIICWSVGMENVLEMCLVSNVFYLFLTLILNCSGIGETIKFFKRRFSNLAIVVFFLRFCGIPLFSVMFWIMFSLTSSLIIHSYWPLVVSMWLLQLDVQLILIFEYIWVIKEKINKNYHSKEMVPVSSRRQRGLLDDNITIMRNVEYPYESFVIQFLLTLANFLLFISGIHLLITQYFEIWLWSSPFFVIFLCVCYYIVKYMNYLFGHNYAILYKEYKENLKNYNHFLYDIYIEDEGLFTERIVCKLKMQPDCNNIETEYDSEDSDSYYLEKLYKA